MRASTTHIICVGPISDCKYCNMFKWKQHFATRLLNRPLVLRGWLPACSCLSARPWVATAPAPSEKWPTLGSVSKWGDSEPPTLKKGKEEKNKKCGSCGSSVLLLLSLWVCLSTQKPGTRQENDNMRPEQLHRQLPTSRQLKPNVQVVP